MDFEDGIQCLKNKTILITGATGFLGKVFLEKILRIQPDVKKLYLLLRVKDDKRPSDRLYDEIISKDLFKVLREEQGVNFDAFISEKVTPVAGDTRLQDLGIENSDLREEMWNEIDAVVHQAASTRFDERYDTALDINTYGAKNIINFVKKCQKLKILVHVSTAYVCGDGTGLIQERELKMGETLNGVSGLDIDAEKRLAENTLLDLQNKRASPKTIRRTMKNLGLQRARMYGWPNTYTFSKALGEMLIGELRDNLHVVIVRPTIISSTWKDPFPGWIEGLGLVILTCMIYAKGYINFALGDRDITPDLIPVDMVVNAMVATMVVNHTEQHRLPIYHVCSSLRNPISSGGKYTDLHYQYFSKNPWKDESGVAVKCPNPRTRTTKNKLIFAVFCAIHIFSILALAIVDILSCHLYKVNYRQMMVQLVVSIKVSSELFRPYSFFQGIFDDENSEKLRIMMHRGGANLDDLNFDPKSIEWEDYILNTHIPGGDPITWVSAHRQHHKFVDTERDPHSPTERFWFSHISWVMDTGYIVEKRGAQNNVDDLKKESFYRFLKSTYMLHPFALGLLLYAWGGFSYVAWGMGLRTVFAFHGTFMLNSVGHVWGNRVWNTGDLSTNNWWLALLTFGEGWHNNHHAFEFSARHGLEWWQVDTTWYTIRLLQAIGLVKDVKLPSESHKIRMAIKSQEVKD